MHRYNAALPAHMAAAVPREAGDLTAAVVAGFKAAVGDGKSAVDVREAMRQVRARGGTVAASWQQLARVAYCTRRAASGALLLSAS